MTSDTWLEIGEASINVLFGCAFGVVIGAVFFWIGGWMTELIFPGVVLRGADSVTYTQSYPLVRGTLAITGFAVGVLSVLAARLRNALLEAQTPNS